MRFDTTLLIVAAFVAGALNAVAGAHPTIRFAMALRPAPLFAGARRAQRSMAG